MKILHVSIGLPPFFTGGSVRYAEDLIISQVSSGDDVAVLIPKKSGYFSKKTTIKTVTGQKPYTIFELINPLPTAVVLGINKPKSYMRNVVPDAYARLLDDFKPKIIHVHTIMGIHKEFFILAKERNIRLVFTTHDFYPLCLKYTLINHEGNLCSGKSPEKCEICNRNQGLPPLLERFMRSYLYTKMKQWPAMKLLRSKARTTLGQSTSKKSNLSESIYRDRLKDYFDLYNYYDDFLSMMDLIHYNSELTKGIYEKLRPNLKGVVIDITHSNLPHRNQTLNRKPSQLRIGYVGGVIRQKGFEVMIRAFKNLQAEYPDEVSLVLWGDDFKNIQKPPNTLIQSTYSIDKIGLVFESMDVLVVPSIGYETFGFVVLEALAYGIPVLCSDLVGAGMLVKSAPQRLIFQSGNDIDLSQCLSQIMDNNTYSSLISFVSKLDLNKDIIKHAHQVKTKIYQNTKEKHNV